MSCFSDEQLALRDAVADLLAKRCPEQRIRELMATETGHDPDLWRELAEMGLLGLVIPEELGGSGAGPVELGLVSEEMGAALMCGPYLAAAVLTPYLLAALDADEERRAVLPRIAAGELIATVAYAEGSSSTLIPAAPATTARPAGDGWAVSGEKSFVLDPLPADVYYVLAATDAGPAVFAVDKGADGLAVHPLETVDQTRKQGRVVFTDAPARLVGRTGQGAEALADALDHAAIALVGEQAGGAYRAMRMAVDYAKTRYQFGRAIGSFQAIKHMCADLLLEAESARSAARHVAAAFAADAPNRLTDLALAQAFCSDAYVFVAANNIQVHGGIGFTWEHPAHLYLRRARTDAQLFGAPATHRERYIERIGA